MKILVLGHARHGKDTVAEMLKQEFNISFESSSIAAAKIFIYDLLKEKYGYANFRVCFEDRINHRTEWHDLIVDYNKDDAARLAKDILEKSDCYVGMRSDREFKECQKQGVFDLVIGVYNPRVPLEDKSSFDIDFWSACDIVIPNNSSIEELRRRVKMLAVVVEQVVEDSSDDEAYYHVGYLDHPWGEKGFKTCEVGHPVYRAQNKQQFLMITPLEGTKSKYVMFPSNTFKETFEKPITFNELSQEVNNYENTLK